MIEVIFLSAVLSKPPVMRKADEHDQKVCFCSYPSDLVVEEVSTELLCATVTASSEQNVVPITDFSPQQDFSLLSTVEKFQRLSAKWSDETTFMSSTSRMVAHPSYQAIIKLGWDVVPLMLQDLQKNRGFWFPALSAITGIRPFDSKDAGNSRKMTQAWINWGHKKGLI